MWIPMFWRNILPLLQGQNEWEEDVAILYRQNDMDGHSESQEQAIRYSLSGPIGMVNRNHEKLPFCRTTPDRNVKKQPL
jgi:hypothetical protein